MRAANVPEPVELDEKRAYVAWCLACDQTISEEVYQALESRGGLDPHCPCCGRAAWEFLDLETEFPGDRPGAP